MFNPNPKPQKDKMTSTEFRELWGSKNRKKKKYNNKSKTYTTSIYGTRTFDSIKEAQYCEELDFLLLHGDIKHYYLQYKIDITINGVHWRNYYIDFKLINKDDSITYVEVKGYATEVWKMKWDAVLIQRDELLESGAELIVIK